MSIDERPRRFGRRRSDFVALDPDDESLSALRAELVLLREENARLKAAPHQSPDIARLLGRARSLTSAPDHDSVTDEAARMLVDGLVIRESLLEICKEIERAMVSFEGRLKALEASGSIRGRP